MASTPRQLSAKVAIVDFAFHPTQNIAILGLVNGKIKFYDFGKEEDRMKCIVRPFDKSIACRSVCFTPKGGEKFIGGFESGSLVLGDSETAKITKTIESKGDDPAAIFTIKAVNDSLFFSGDDCGFVKLFDVRQAENKPVVMFSNCFDDENDENVVSTDDWVSDIYICKEGGHQILVSRSDGTICTYSTRRGGREVLRSEPLGGELTGMAGPIKGGRKFAVSASDGAVNIFNFGQWGNISDRVPVNKPQKRSVAGKSTPAVSVDSMCILTDSLLFAGCGDGKIRLVSIQPNAILATIGTHAVDYPVEHLRLTNDSSFLASSSHDETVHFWSTAPYQKVNLAYQSSEDEDSDGEGGDSDDSSASSTGGPRRQPRLKKRRKEIKAKLAQKHSFFADLDKDPAAEEGDSAGSESGDDDDDGSSSSGEGESFSDDSDSN